MEDIYERVEEGRTALAKTLDVIPGWSGYQERQSRRQADKLLRRTLAEKLNDQQRRLNTAQKELIAHARWDLVDDVESAVTQLRTFVDRVRFASYGYAGLFDAVKIRRNELRQLYEFDAALIEYVERLETANDHLRSAIDSGEGLEESVRAVQEVTREANSAFDQRERLILGSQ